MSNNPVYGTDWRKMETRYLMVAVSGGNDEISELDKSISGITQKMLSQQLKGLEETGTIKRVSYPVIPPKVEYSLTEKGKTLFSVLDGLCKWSENNLSR
jgi:DNA-binding HxlR family transcriptional regulator